MQKDGQNTLQKKTQQEPEITINEETSTIEKSEKKVLQEDSNDASASEEECLSLSDSAGSAGYADFEFAKSATSNKTQDDSLDMHAVGIDEFVNEGKDKTAALGSSSNILCDDSPDGY